MHDQTNSKNRAAAPVRRHQEQAAAAAAALCSVTRPLGAACTLNNRLCAHSSAHQQRQPQLRGAAGHSLRSMADVDVWQRARLARFAAFHQPRTLRLTRACVRVRRCVRS